MPIDIKDCDGGIGNIIVGRGIITDQGLIDSLKKHLTQDKEKLKKYKFSLTDFTAVLKLAIDSEGVKFIAELSEEASKVNPDPIVAIVSKKDHIYGLSRMYESLIGMTNWKIMVFRSKTEAVEWIMENVRERFGIGNLTFG